MNAILLLLAFLPTSTVPISRVDVIELNRVFSSDFKQEHGRYYVFWNLQSVESKPDYHVVAWRSYSHVGARPMPVNNRWRLMWVEDKARRNVVGRVFIETASNYDPEIADREVLPESKRKGFGR